MLLKTLRRRLLRAFACLVCASATAQDVTAPIAASDASPDSFVQPRDPRALGPMTDTEKAALASKVGSDNATWQQQRRRVPREQVRQHEELVRLSAIALPNFEDRNYFEALLGIGFPSSDPIQGNVDWLKNYLSSRPEPTAAEQKSFLDSLKAELLFVKGGDFMMGDFGTMTKYKLRIAYGKSSAPHKVVLDSYSLMKGRVTFREYDFYSRVSKTPPIDIEDVALFRRFPGYTVRPATWAQANDYCSWLANFMNLPFSLPTEAQWEYAARERGKFIAYPAYNIADLKLASEYIPDMHSLDSALALMQSKAGLSTKMVRPEPPDLYGANRIGMQGVLGPTVEWVSDWYDDSVPMEASHNPKGPSTGTRRVTRYGADGEYRSVITRFGELPENTHHATQFRCAVNANKPLK